MDLTDPQQWNAYGYSNNNPTTWSDPTGLLPDDGGSGGTAGMTPQSPPKVSHPGLQEALKHIYLRPGETAAVGSGATAEAAMHELRTGNPAKAPEPGGPTRWRVEKSAVRLNSITKILHDDAQSGGKVLSPGDRSIAIREAGKLFSALETPDVTGNVTKGLKANPQSVKAVRAGIDAAVRSPSLAEITGTPVGVNQKSGIRYVAGAPRYPAIYGQLGGVTGRVSGGASGSRAPSLGGLGGGFTPLPPIRGGGGAGSPLSFR